MRIAMIHTPLLGRGGAHRQILSLTIELQKAGNEVEIFTNAVNEETCYPELLKQVTVNVVPNPLIPFRYNSSSSNSSIKEVHGISNVRMWLQRIVRSAPFYTSELPSMLSLGRTIPKGFDIINNHNFPTEWAAFIAKKRLRVPVVWMCNEPPFWFFAWKRRKVRKIYWPLFGVLDKVAVKYIDEIVALSHIAAGHVKKAYNRSARVVRSGVDIDLFHNASGKDVRRKHDLENDFVLLQVGNIDPVRRQSDSIMALYCLSRNYDNVKLILDGGGRAGPREELTRLSENLGVKDKVLFWHTKSDEELARVYAACDVFVFPSQITWGLAVTEAMAAGKPVIVSKNCGASEIIQSGVNGIIVDHAKPKEIGEQAELLMNNPKSRKKLGEHAYEYVKSNLSWEKYAKNMESVFQRAIVSFRRNL